MEIALGRSPREQQYVLVDLTPMPLAGAHRAWVLAAVLTAIFVDASSSSLSTSTLGSIQGEYALGPDQGAWFLIVFNAAYWAAIISSVWLMARVGRRRFLLASLVAYAATTLLCCVAPNAATLLAFRFLQGAAQGGLFTTSAAIILTVHRREEIGVAFFGLAIVVTAGGIVGPLIGGAFVEFGAWREAFAWSALVALVAAVIAMRALPNDATHRRIPYDLAGLALALAAFIPLQYLINEGERRDWFGDPGVVVAAVATPAALAAFLVWKLRFAAHPFLDLRVFRVRLLTVGAAIVVLIQLPSFTSTLFVQYAQLGAGFSPTEAGWALALRALTIALAVPAIGLVVVSGRTTARAAFTLGFVPFVALLLVLSTRFTSGTDLAAFVLLALTIGFAQGVTNQPLPVLIFGSLSPAQIPMGAIVFKMAPLIGQSIANVIGQRLIDVRSAQWFADLAGGVSLHAPAVAAFMQRAGPHPLAPLVIREATVLAYADATRWLALAGLLALPLVLLLPGARK